MELSTEEGFSETLKKIVQTQNMKDLIGHFKKIILDAYGVRSEDGKRFIKSQQLRDEFVQTAAYNALFMDLATNDDVALAFIRGVLPSDMMPELDKELKAAVKASPLATSAELPTPIETKEQT